MKQVVIYEKTPPTAVISLNRLDYYNAIDNSLVSELLNVCCDAKHDDEIRSVIITGKSNAFCSGGDVQFMANNLPDIYRVLRKLAGLFHLVILELYTMPKPTIAAINGAAAGGGFSLAMACDYRIMSESAVFVFGYPSIGLTPDGGLSWILPRLLGMTKALELAMFNEKIDSSAALELGLVNRVVSADKLMEEAHDVAVNLSSRPIRALAKTRELFLNGLGRSLQEQLDLERESIALHATLPEGQKGIQDFVKKK